MLRKTIEVSRQAVHLAVRLGQLALRPKPAGGRRGEEAGSHGARPRSVPCEDVGLLVVDNMQTTYSHASLAALMECGAAVVICGGDHLPAGVLLPVPSHSEVVPRLRDQANASRPVCKRIWQQIVVAKVRAQAANLPVDSPEHGLLNALAKEVRSGDPSNVEGQAARAYWRRWFALLDERVGGIECPRRSRPDADDLINAMLNYGYAVLRAAVARAIVGAGLAPALGLHHHTRSNAFALADDLVEPFRPIVDARVARYAVERAPCGELDQPAKAALLDLLAAKVRTGERTGPLMAALHRMCASLADCYAGRSKRLLIPKALGDSRTA